MRHRAKRSDEKGPYGTDSNSPISFYFTLLDAGFPKVNGIIGVGYQFAVGPNPVFFSASGDRTPQYNHEWIISSRITF